MDLGEPQRALDDLNKVIELEPEPVAFIMRGEVYRFLGEYQKAVADYAHAEAMDPAEWQDNGFVCCIRPTPMLTLVMKPQHWLAVRVYGTISGRPE